MEFTPTQISMINTFLPAKYKIEIASKSDSRPRRSEAESLDFNVRFQPRIPEKRLQRENSSGLEDLPEPKIKHTEGVKRLLKILAEIKTHPKVHYFLHSVDKKAYPDYYEKIKEPMDINTIENKLKNGYYETVYQFALDMRLIWNNSFFYNTGKYEIYSATLELSMLFEKLIKGSEELVLSEEKSVVQEVYKKTEKTSNVVKSAPAKVEAAPPKPIVKQVVEKPMGFSEKKQLCQNIKKLEPKYLKGVLDIVKECTDTKGEELEFDIEKLPPRVCRELDKYVKNCLQNISRSQKNKKLNTVETIKYAQEATSAKITSVNSQLEKLENPKSEVYMPEEESESESSSTSESEDDEEVPQITSQLDNPYLPKDDDHNDFSASFSHMIDFDNIY